MDHWEISLSIGHSLDRLLSFIGVSEFFYKAHVRYIINIYGLVTEDVNLL